MCDALNGSDFFPRFHAALFRGCRRLHMEANFPWEKSSTQLKWIHFMHELSERAIVWRWKRSNHFKCLPLATRKIEFVLVRRFMMMKKWKSSDAKARKISLARLGMLDGNFIICLHALMKILHKTSNFSFSSSHNLMAFIFLRQVVDVVKASRIYSQERCDFQ